MNNTLVVNMGHKNYGYRNVLADYGVPQEMLDIKPSKLEKFVKIASKAIMIIEIALLALDLCAGTSFASVIAPGAVATAGDLIDLGPLNTFQHELWLLMLRGILYLAIPVYGWCGYVFALAGQNGGKRTAAKWIAASMTGGIAFVAGAPWAGNAVYKFFRAIFHV
jgi:hypothetical protein